MTIQLLESAKKPEVIKYTIVHMAPNYAGVGCLHTCMGETAAAGGVFMGLGLSGVRGSCAGGTGTVGGSAVPLEAGPAAKPEGSAGGGQGLNRCHTDPGRDKKKRNKKNTHAISKRLKRS